MMGVLGIQLSEENDTVRRYVVTHHDPNRNLLFHPVLLEKLHKSNDTYSFDDYVAELNQITGASYSADAWREVSTGSLKKKDKKFKVYLGLCKDEKEDPADYSVEDPPILDVHFARETWIMPNAKYKDYKLAAKTPSDGPWWARFVTEEQRVEKAEAAKGRIHQPYTIPIASEPVIQRPPSLRPSKERLLDPIESHRHAQVHATALRDASPSINRSNAFSPAPAVDHAKAAATAASPSFAPTAANKVASPRAGGNPYPIDDANAANAQSSARASPPLSLSARASNIIAAIGRSLSPMTNRTSNNASPDPDQARRACLNKSNGSSPIAGDPIAEAEAELQTWRALAPVPASPMQHGKPPIKVSQSPSSVQAV